MGEIMKKITKITGLLAALLILLCFVSCKQNAASTPEPNLVASFKGTMTSSGTETMGSTLSSYDDSSFKNTINCASLFLVSFVSFHINNVFCKFCLLGLFITLHSLSGFSFVLCNKYSYE